MSTPSKHKINISSFFDKNYLTPNFIKAKQVQDQQNKSRRRFLKSAAGMSSVPVLAGLPSFSMSAEHQNQFNSRLQSDPWLTLDATLTQLLPASETGPSASDIRATQYLYQVMTVQPTESEEKEFILKGVGWLNGYAQSEKSARFIELSFAEKEQLLKGISKSKAGRNWLNTLIGYIYQAMLAPESYGGNPKGIGWQWLEHQAGFPLPKAGQRYFELPTRARINLMSHVEYRSKRETDKNHDLRTPNPGTRKA